MCYLLPLFSPCCEIHCETLYRLSPRLCAYIFLFLRKISATFYWSLSARLSMTSIKPNECGAQAVGPWDIHSVNRVSNQRRQPSALSGINRSAIGARRVVEGARGDVNRLWFVAGRWREERWEGATERGRTAEKGRRTGREEGREREGPAGREVELEEKSLTTCNSAMSGQSVAYRMDGLSENILYAVFVRFRTKNLQYCVVIQVGGA